MGSLLGTISQNSDQVTSKPKEIDLQPLKKSLRVSLNYLKIIKQYCQK